MTLTIGSFGDIIYFPSHAHLEATFIEHDWKGCDEIPKKDVTHVG